MGCSSNWIPKWSGRSRPVRLNCSCARELTHVKPDRQIEILDLMDSCNDYGAHFRQRSGAEDAGVAKRTKVNGAKTPWAQAEQKKTNLLKRLQDAEQQQDFFSGLYKQYTTNLLKLVIYVRALLANQKGARIPQRAVRPTGRLVRTDHRQRRTVKYPPKWSKAMIDPALRKEVICQDCRTARCRTADLASRAVLKDAPELHQLACEQFGAWDTALQYAGVSLRSLSARHKYTKEQVDTEYPPTLPKRT